MKTKKSELFNDPYHIFHIDYHHCRFYNYIISDEGKIYGNRGLIKTHKPSNKFYRVVTLKINSDYYHFYVHQLVAKLFIPNPNNYSQINHIDGNGFNNRISNLQWTSPKNNIWHARYILKREMGSFTKCLLDGKPFDNVTEAMLSLGFPRKFSDKSVIKLLKNKRLIIYKTKNKNYLKAMEKNYE